MFKSFIRSAAIIGAVMILSLFAAILLDEYLSTVDDSKISLTQEELDYIAENPVVKYAAEENRPPFISWKEGKVQGLSYDYLQLISKKTGLQFQAVRTGTTIDSLTAIYNNEVDLVTTIRPTPELNSYLTFTPSLTVYHGLLLFKINHLPPSSPIKIAMQAGYRNSIYYALSTRYPQIQLFETEDDEASLALLQRQLVDAVVMDEAAANYWINKNRLKLQKVIVSFNYPYAFGYRNNDLVLGSVLTKAINSISEADKRKLNSKWLKKSK